MADHVGVSFVQMWHDYPFPLLIYGDPINQNVTDGSTDPSSADSIFNKPYVAWAHVGIIVAFVVVCIVIYATFRRGTQHVKETSDMSVSIFSVSYWAEYIPHSYVTLSAMVAAVMSMEAGAVQAKGGMPAACLACVAASTSAIVLATFIVVAQVYNFSETTENPWLWHCVQGLLSSNTPLMAFYAIPRIGLSQACALMFTMPLWTAMLAGVVLRSPWGWSQIVLSVACLVGVILVLQPKGMFGGGPAPAIDGVVSALMFAIFNAGAIIVTNEKLRKENPVLLSFFMMFFGAIVAAILLATGALPELSGTATAEHDGMTNPSMVIQAILVGGLLTLMNNFRSAGFCMAKSSNVANMLYLEILFANLLDIFVVHGNVNALSCIGAATILFGSIGSTMLG